MATSYKNLSVSLPTKMLAHVNAAAKKGNRTRSELVREALRLYFAHLPTERITTAEKNAVQKGMREISKGEFENLEALAYGMGDPRG